MPNNSLKEHLLAIIKKSKELSNSKVDKNKKSGTSKEEDVQEAGQQQNSNEKQKASKVSLISFLLFFHNNCSSFRLVWTKLD